MAVQERGISYTSKERRSAPWQECRAYLKLREKLVGGREGVITSEDIRPLVEPDEERVQKILGVYSGGVRGLIEEAPLKKGEERQDLIKAIGIVEGSNLAVDCCRIGMIGELVLGHDYNSSRGRRIGIDEGAFEKLELCLVSACLSSATVKKVLGAIYLERHRHHLETKKDPDLFGPFHYCVPGSRGELIDFTWIGIPFGELRKRIEELVGGEDLENFAFYIDDLFPNESELGEANMRLYCPSILRSFAELVVSVPRFPGWQGGWVPGPIRETRGRVFEKIRLSEREGFKATLLDDLP